MRDRSVGVALLLVVLCVGSAVGVVAAVPTGDPGARAAGVEASAAPSPAPERSVRAGTPPDGTVTDQIETDAVRIRIDVAANASATWTIEYRTFLDDENTTAAFEELQADIRTNRSEYTDRFARRIRNTVAAAENATGREMTATDFDVEATTEQVSCPSPSGCGVITYTFRWDGFARATDGGDRIAVGDAIEGFFLGQDTRMTVQWPAEYGRVETSPAADDTGPRSVVWRGESTDFGPGEPRVVVERGATTTTTTTGGTTAANGDGGGTAGTTSTTTTTGESGGLPLVPLGIGVLVLLVLVAAVAYFWSGAGGGAGPLGATSTPGGAGGGGTLETDGASQAATEEATGEEDGETDGDDDEEFDIDQELLSNEEQVLKLLEASGGRMKQQEVVSELGWTEAKTSQVISAMRDDDAVETFRLGRENVVTLPDEDLGVGPDDGEGGR